MTDTRDVTGITCIPIPAQNRGQKVLSTTYRAEGYKTVNKCFNIEVVSTQVTIDAGQTKEALPRGTVNFVVRVTNEKGVPVNDGQVDLYYNSEQTNPSVAGLANEFIDNINIVNNGTAELQYTVPSNFRSGLVQFRIRYSNSHEGYANYSITQGCYIFRQGDLKLDFQVKNNENQWEEIDEYYNVPIDTKAKVTATLKDGTDNNAIPLEGVMTNIKMNNGTLIDAETNANGKVTCQTQTFTRLGGDATITAKNEGKKYVGENTVSQELKIATHSRISSCSIITTHLNKFIMDIEVVGEGDVAEETMQCAVKLNNVTLPQNGNFANPNEPYVVRTDSNGLASFECETSLSPGHDYTVSIMVGGKPHTAGCRYTDIGIINFDSEYHMQNFYELQNDELVLVLSERDDV